jgi:hypothetical protein
MSVRLCERIAQYWIHAKWKQTRSKYLFNELNNWLSLKCHFPSPSVIYGPKLQRHRGGVEELLGSPFVYSFYVLALCSLRADTAEGWWLSRCEMMITSAIVCWSFDAQLAFCCLSMPALFLLSDLVSKFYCCWRSKSKWNYRQFCVIRWLSWGWSVRELGLQLEFAFEVCCWSFFFIFEIWTVRSQFLPVKEERIGWKISILNENFVSVDWSY